MRRHLCWTLPSPLPESPPLRPLDEADPAALAAMFAAAYHGTVDDEGEGPAEAAAEIAAARAGRYGPFLEAASGFVGPAEAPDGAIFLAQHALGGLDHPFVLYIVVAPRAQGQGLGRHLLLASAAAVQTQGHTHLHLVVTAGNGPAERIYKSLGWTEHARR